MDDGVDPADWVRRASNGDRQAAETIYDQYVGLVRAIVDDVVSNRADREELVQEVFLTIFRRLDQLRDARRLSGWIVEITRHASIDFLRRASRRRDQTSEMPLQAVVVPDRSADEVEALQYALRQLEHRERLAVHIFYLCEQPAETARQTLGLSSSGFYKLLERAKQRLRITLERLEVLP